MRTLRTGFHLAIALTLLSLTCDLGAVCSLAGMEGECCCMTEDGSSPCTEMSQSDSPPGSPAPTPGIASGERFAAAVLDLPANLASPLELPAAPGAAPRLAPPAAPTPLYLSHCAFLC